MQHHLNSKTPLDTWFIKNNFDIFVFLWRIKLVCLKWPNKKYIMLILCYMLHATVTYL